MYELSVNFFKNRPPRLKKTRQSLFSKYKSKFVSWNKRRVNERKQVIRDRQVSQAHLIPSPLPPYREINYRGSTAYVSSNGRFISKETYDRSRVTNPTQPSPEMPIEETPPEPIVEDGRPNDKPVTKSKKTKQTQPLKAQSETQGGSNGTWKWFTGGGVLILSALSGLFFLNSGKKPQIASQ